MTLEHTRRKRSSGAWRLFFLLNAVALFFLVIAFGREYVGNLQIEQEIRALEEQRAALEQEKLDTLALIEQLSSEEYLEEEARTKHGLGREGETLVVIQDSTAEEATAADVLTEDMLADVPNFLRWYYYFFDQAAFDDLAEEEAL